MNGHLEVCDLARVAMNEVLGKDWDPIALEMTEHIKASANRLIAFRKEHGHFSQEGHDVPYQDFRRQQISALSSHINFFQPIGFATATRAAESAWRILEDLM